MSKYIIQSPKSEKCVLFQNLDKFFTEEEEEDFKKWVRGKECIGIEKDGKVDVAIPMILINQFMSQS